MAIKQQPSRTIHQVYTFYVSYYYFSQAPYEMKIIFPCERLRESCVSMKRFVQCHPVNKEKGWNFNPCFLVPRPDGIRYTFNLNSTEADQASGLFMLYLDAFSLPRTYFPCVLPVGNASALGLTSTNPNIQVAELSLPRVSKLDG